MNNNPIALIDPDGRDWDWAKVTNVASAAITMAVGVTEMASGVAIGVATSWTGVGAVGGALLAGHGASTFTAGFGNLMDALDGKDVSMNSNGPAETIGESVGGKTGKAIGSAIDTGISMVTPGGVAKSMVEGVKAVKSLKVSGKTAIEAGKAIKDAGQAANKVVKPVKKLKKATDEAMEAVKEDKEDTSSN
jgi:hypothetical protein